MSSRGISVNRVPYHIGYISVFPSNFRRDGVVGPIPPLVMVEPEEVIHRAMGIH